MIKKHFHHLASLATLVAVLAAAPACYGITASGETATPVHVTTFFTYPQAAAGDVAVNVDSVTPGCEGGFWISKADVGYTATYAAILMAYATKNPVNIWYDSTQMWSGSSAHACKIYAFNPV